MPRALSMLVLIGLTVAGCYSNRAAVRAAEPVVATAPELQLAGFVPVAGTSWFRAQLMKPGGPKQAKAYAHGSTHNLLFVDAATGTARWLLPDDDHEIVSLSDLPEREEYAAKPPPVVTVALVKPHAEDMELATGRLLVFSPAGDRIVEVANEVRVVGATALIEGTKLSVVYERARKYVVAQVDLQQFVLLTQQEITPPPLQ
jgi:hypothetical protein